MRSPLFLLLLPAALLSGLALLAFPLPIWTGPASAAGGLLEIGDAMSGLPNNAAWQGIANDGTFFYLLTSQSTSMDILDGKENIIRKYRISDGQLVAIKNDAYPEDRRFSSGEVIDGKLYVAVRDANTLSTWAHVAVYDTASLSLLEDHDIETIAGYAVPEGVAKKDSHFWVIFGGAGNGSGNVKVSAVVKYDLGWNEIAAYELLTLPSGNFFGGQDILWINNTEIVTNMHEDKAPGEDKLDRWKWTGDGFVRVARYPQLDDDATHTIGQGFTWLDGYMYFAARYSDRVVKAELVDAAKPTPTPTVTLTPAPTAKPLPTPKATPTPNPSANGSLEVDTNCAEDGIQSQRNALLGVPFTVCLFAEFPSPNSAAGYQVRLEWDPSILQLDPRMATDNDVWSQTSQSECGPPNGASVSQNAGTGFIELSAVDTGNENAICVYQGVVAELVFSCQSHAPTNLEMTGPGTNTFFSDSGVAQVKPSLKAAVIICLEPEFDSDLDGCSNEAELDPKSGTGTGGQRDPLYFWDFFDTPTGVPPERDRAITVGDIGAVVARFGTSGDPGADPLSPPPVSGYHTAFDRTPLGPELWNLGPPDGNITVQDVGGVVAQFGHTCA